jgi:predicted RNA binding protein YcfA (HicA-like mRNA interferase family)
MPTIKVREAIRQVEAAGWRIVRQTGSHRHYHHPSKPGIVTIAGKPSDDLPAKTWGRIKQQAGI